MYFLTDHAQLVRLCMLALDRIDPKHFRWFQEIVMNGSELVSLAGRTMVLGDSFSRNPEHRDALLAALEARSGDLKQMHEVLKGFDVDELRTTEPWEGGFKPPPHKEITKNWPGVIQPTGPTDKGPAGRLNLLSHSYKFWGAHDAEDVKKALILLVLPPTPVDSRKYMVDKLEKHVIDNFKIRVRSVVAQSAETDPDTGAESYLRPRGKDVADRKKKLRAQMLYATTLLLREIVRWRPHLVVGQGQGGLVALTLAFPRVLEAACRARISTPQS